MKRDGFALIGALWLVVAIATVAMGVELGSRTRRLGALIRINATQSELAANAGLEHAMAYFSSSIAATAVGSSVQRSLNDMRFSRSQRVPDSVDLEGSGYRLRVRDLGTTVNVNLATEAELRRLLVALRVDVGVAQALAESIADWRDADDFPRSRGAERDAYLAEGRAVLPRNRNFQSLAELRFVRGMGPRLFEDLKPYLSVVSSGQVNLATAPPAVLMTLPGFGQEAANAVVRAQHSRGGMPTLDELALRLSPSARAALTPQLPLLASRTTMGLSEIEVTSDGWGQVGHHPGTRAIAIMHLSNEGVLLRTRYLE